MSLHALSETSDSKTPVKRFPEDEPPALARHGTVETLNMGGNEWETSSSSGPNQARSPLFSKQTKEIMKRKNIDIEVMSNEIEKLTDENEMLKESLHRLQDENSQLRVINADLENQGDISEDDDFHQELRNKLEEEKIKCRKLEDELASSKRKLKHYREVTEKNSTEATSNMEKLSKQMISTNQQIIIKNREIHELTGKNTDLITQNDDLKRQVKHFKKALKSYESEIEKMKATIESKESANKKLTRDMEHTAKKLNRVTFALDTSWNQNSLLRMENEKRIEEKKKTTSRA